MASFKSILKRIKGSATPSRPTMPALGPQHAQPFGSRAQQQEREAFQLLRSAIQENFSKLFAGAHFKSNVDEDDNDAQSAIDVADTVLGQVAELNAYNGVKEAAETSPLDVALGLAKKLTGLNSTPDVIAAVGLSTLRDFYTSVTPFLCCFQSFGGAARTLYGAVGDKRDSLRAIEAQPLVIAGDPQAALRAVGTMLDRRGNDRLAEGTMQAVEATVNAALSSTGVGALATSGVSLAGKLGALTVVIHRRGVEYREMKKGQAALGIPGLSISVFGDCPLLGCYMLVCSDSSAIYLSALGNGVPAMGWMDQVEASHRYIDPLMEKSREMMSESLWRLEGPNLQKGLTQQGGRITGVAIDSRPWTEKFLISRFGTKNFAYRSLKKGQQLQEYKAKVEDAVGMSVWGKMEDKIKAEWAGLVAKKTPTA